MPEGQNGASLLNHAETNINLGTLNSIKTPDKHRRPDSVAPPDGGLHTGDPIDSPRTPSTPEGLK